MEPIVRIDCPVGGQHPAGLKLAHPSIDKPSDRSNNDGLPVLIAIGVAVAEVRRRRAKAERAGDSDAHR
jgi:hypothetical protein